MPRNRPPHSAYQPPMPTIDAASSVPRNRDSVQTRESTSSSLYPMSTHTVSPSESSLSPHSLISQTQDNGITTFDPDSQVVDEFDGDDVSYRLRLLVKNSYFLPPAHSKPSSSDLTSPLKAQEMSSRAGTPTFLGFFRLGRSRSRPSTPSSSTTAVESCGPMLRTTSDSNTVNGRMHRSQARPMPRSPSQPFHKGALKRPYGSGCCRA